VGSWHLAFFVRSPALRATYGEIYLPCFFRSSCINRHFTPSSLVTHLILNPPDPSPLQIITLSFLPSSRAFSLVFHFASEFTFFVILEFCSRRFLATLRMPPDFPSASALATPLDLPGSTSPSFLLLIFWLERCCPLFPLTG